MSGADLLEAPLFNDEIVEICVVDGVGSDVEQTTSQCNGDNASSRTLKPAHLGDSDRYVVHWMMKFLMLPIQLTMPLLVSAVNVDVAGKSMSFSHALKRVFLCESISL